MAKKLWLQGNLELVVVHYATALPAVRKAFNTKVDSAPMHHPSHQSLPNKTPTLVTIYPKPWPYYLQRKQQVQVQVHLLKYHGMTFYNTALLLS